MKSRFTLFLLRKLLPKTRKVWLVVSPQGEIVSIFLSPEGLTEFRNTYPDHTISQAYLFTPEHGK